MSETVMVDNILYGVIGIQIFMAICLIFMTNKILPPISKYLKQRGDDDAIVYFDVITIGTLIWPLLWYFVVGFQSIKECPILLISFLWPFALGIFQLYDSYHDKCEDTQDHQQQRVALIGGIHTDTATVISFAFASATLFWAIGDKQNSLPSIRILVVALLICIGLIVPTQHFIDNNQRYTSYIRAAQRVFVNYSMGFIMTALIVILSNCLVKKEVIT